MPKVTEEYIANKKRAITSAAYELCLEKTVSTVTMQDIINRTGLSQGGIYRFYHDIDEIFGDMLVEIRKKVCIKDKVDEIFSQGDKMPVKEVTNRIIDLLADFMTEELMGIQKVDFELSVLAMNAPARVEKILAGITGMGNKEYLLLRASAFYREKARQGQIHLKVGEMELMTYISSAYAGIQQCCIVNNCYQRNEMSDYYQPRIQLNTLGKTVNYLLGLDF